MAFAPPPLYLDTYSVMWKQGITTCACFPGFLAQDSSMKCEQTHTISSGTTLILSVIIGDSKYTLKHVHDLIEWAD